MIITCEQCHKKFEIESNLIPKKGRLLQCSSCSHKWFYKSDILEETKVVLEQQDIKTKKKEELLLSQNANQKPNTEILKQNKRGKSKGDFYHDPTDADLTQVQMELFILYFLTFGMKTQKKKQNFF